MTCLHILEMCDIKNEMMLKFSGVTLDAGTGDTAFKQNWITEWHDAD